MLPRVSAALGKFLTPIASTSASPNTQQEQGKNGDQSASQKKKRHLEPVPSPTLRTPVQTGAHTQSSVSASSQETKLPQVHAMPLSTAFLNIFSFLRKQTLPFIKWLGLEAYRFGINQGRRSGKFKKGAIVDHKAE